MSAQEDLKVKIIDTLKEIFDPEIPVNVWDLGFIYGIEITDDSKVAITMTLTVPGCPMHNIISAEIRDKVGKVEGVAGVDVIVTFDPRWSVEKITDDGKQRLRSMGYNI
jgi:metal-sulfur cluster biosynthetic enzyme